MRLKALPDDFIVREAANLRIRKQPAPYRVYLLEKTGWNTVDALVRIARERKVPYARFAYGGKKDRHAHTFQYVTVQAPVDLSHQTGGYKFTLLGFTDQPMVPSLITANHFEITLRDLTEQEREHLESGSSALQRGIPNYFDDQRFGNMDRERGFVAERMLQGRWEEALDLALTSIYPGEHSEAKARKRALRERWGDWPGCRALARTALEQRSFDLLIDNPSAFRQALGTVHQETAAMWLSTYQSFLWNEVLRRLIDQSGWGGPSLPGVAGAYLLAAPTDGLASISLPLPGRGMRMEHQEAGLILEEVLRERRLRPAALEAELLPGLWLRVSPRPALLKAASVWLDPAAPDDLYPGRLKATLRFTLPRGSYATLCVKAMLAGEANPAAAPAEGDPD